MVISIAARYHIIISSKYYIPKITNISCGEKCIQLEVIGCEKLGEWILK